MSADLHAEIVEILDYFGLNGVANRDQAATAILDRIGEQP